jgi:hypothetical protein
VCEETRQHGSEGRAALQGAALTRRGFPDRVDPVASAVAPTFLSVRYKVLLSGSAEDDERRTLPWLSSVTWSTSGS